MGIKWVKWVCHENIDESRMIFISCLFSVNVKSVRKFLADQDLRQLQTASAAKTYFCLPITSDILSAHVLHCLSITAVFPRQIFNCFYHVFHW